MINDNPGKKAMTLSLCKQALHRQSHQKFRKMHVPMYYIPHHSYRLFTSNHSPQSHSKILPTRDRQERQGYHRSAPLLLAKIKIMTYLEAIPSPSFLFPSRRRGRQTLAQLIIGLGDLHNHSSSRSSSQVESHLLFQ